MNICMYDRNGWLMWGIVGVVLVDKLKVRFGWNKIIVLKFNIFFCCRFGICVF